MRKIDRFSWSIETLNWALKWRTNLLVGRGNLLRIQTLSLRWRCVNQWTMMTCTKKWLEQEDFSDKTSFEDWRLKSWSDVEMSNLSTFKASSSVERSRRVTLGAWMTQLSVRCWRLCSKKCRTNEKDRKTASIIFYDCNAMRAAVEKPRLIFREENQIW